MTITITDYAREGDFTDLQAYTCAQMGPPLYLSPDGRAKERFDIIVLDANRQIEVMRQVRYSVARLRVYEMIENGINAGDIQIAQYNQSGIGFTREGHLCSLIDIWPDLIPTIAFEMGTFVEEDRKFESVNVPIRNIAVYFERMLGRPPQWGARDDDHDDEERIRLALIEAGAPSWVKHASAYVSAGVNGIDWWNLVGPEIDENE